MTPLVRRLGRLLYWPTWPLVWLNLYGSQRARVLVVCGNYVVVTKGWLSDGKWTLPGGGIRTGENSLDAALRELYEETGIHLAASQVQRHSEQVAHDGGIKFNYVLFVATLKRKLPLQPVPAGALEFYSAISAAQWIERQALTAANAHADVLTAIAARWGHKHQKKPT